MSGKRTRSLGLSGTSAAGSPSKKLKTAYIQNSYFRKALVESGLTVKYPPEKCVINQETVHIVRNIKKNLEKHIDYPRNLSDFFASFERECQDLSVFKHFLFHNIVRRTEDSPEDCFITDSLIKILLSIPILQNKLTDYIFEKAIDLAVDSKCGPWIQMILKCFSSLDCIMSTDKISTHLINLLDMTTEKTVKLEIITAIPDIIGDQEHSNIAAEMSRILNEDHDLIPAILDCLSYLCLSDEQYEQLQKKTLNILITMTRCTYFPNFIKFLLMPGRMNDPAYFEAVQGIRNSLNWPSTMAKPQEIATSQVLTASTIRSSMLSSKVISSAWLKVISSCKISTDHKPFDFVILLIACTISEEKQKQVENLIKKQIKSDILKEELLDECFEKFVPILKDNLKSLINLTNSLLKTKADPVVVSYASHIYTLMFSKLDDCCQTIVAELLQLGLDCQQAVMSILLVLNNVALDDMSILKPQSVQMLTLLDRMDNMSLNEIRAVMNLLCGLAYSYENSVIRDDIHMIIRKELSSSIPKIKIQGILAGLHAVKFLMCTNNDSEQTSDFPDDVSYSSVSFLPEGDLREAAQIIELISRSTRQFPDMIAFFYDEMTIIINAATTINKNFLSWLTDAVTNDLQENFIVDTIETDRIGEIKLSMQYCINAESEVDETISINIAGLTLQPKVVVNIGILSPLFQLVQTLHYRQHDGTLSSIDALLGCPVIMPNFDVDLLEDLENTTVHNILDCLVHCVNWFRELLNAFTTQDDEALKTKILKRLLHIEALEGLITEVLIKCKSPYKLPSCIFNVHKYTGDQVDKRPLKILKNKVQKKTNRDETVLSETARTQATQNNNNVKNKIQTMHNMPLRQLNLNLLHLLNNDIGTSNEENVSLTIKSLNFLIKCINNKLDSVLVSKFKRNTFLAKQEETVYDAKKAEKCAKSVSEVLPKMMDHLTHVLSYLDTNTPPGSQDDSGFIFTAEIVDYLSCLEGMYNMYTIYFKWTGFRNHHSALLKTSLRTIATADDNNANVVSLKELLLATAKYFQKHEKFCLFLSVAISLIELMKTIQEYSDSRIILKMIRDMAQNFLAQQWKTLDGVPEKGLVFNQNVDKLAQIFFINNEMLALKNLTLQIANEIKSLKSRNDTLASFKCVNKGNFAVLFRNLGNAIYESSKTRLNKGLTNAEHLDLWKDVAIVLKNMSDIAKTLENRNNLSAFFNKSVPILKLFLSQGMPILELQLKSETEEVLEILKILQQSTRFLQSLCCHSRLKKDKVLMSKVPYMRQLLETLIYKVKAALAANNCSEAFWMGNLKNKDIHGEIIATQQSIESEESVEDCDDQLPEDDDSNDSDNDMINPDSKSISDIV